jgi:hypothetical protein
MIHLEQLHDGCRPAFENLLRETWQPFWDDELSQQVVQWRYYDRPASAVTWLVLEKDRCIAMLDSMLRPYMLDGERIIVRETADWYCTPDRRKFGVGLWLLRKLTVGPEPIFVLGGSELTMAILPKLKWESLPSASSYILPIKARGLVANLIRQGWWEYEALARTIPNFLPLRPPRHIAPPQAKRAEMHVLTPDDTVNVIPPKQTGLVQLLETSHWQWLARMPTGLAMPLGLQFSLDGVPVGVSFSQIEPSASGLDAKIVHLQFTDASIGAWVISATAQTLANRGVGFIRCCASTAEKTTALERVGFIKSKEIPCHWLPHMVGIPSSIDVGYLRGDDAMPFQALRGRIGGHYAKR